MLGFGKGRSRVLQVQVVVPAEDPSPKFFAQCLNGLAIRMDELPQEMCVVFQVPRGMTIDFPPEDERRCLRISYPGKRSTLCNLAGRWIPEHPVPLVFTGYDVLNFRPTSTTRFHVTAVSRFRLVRFLRRLFAR